MIRHDLFTHVVNNLLHGRTQEQLSEQLAECVERARETGKQSTLTLKLTVKPVGQTGQYELRDSISAKLPELERGMSLFYGTPEGNLTRTDPNQQSLDLKSVGNDEPTNLKNAEAN